ncbi:MAG TPA: hypothetical protein VHG92_01595, partial [Afifellaceae bacterium]|nr:hypothetical protein [Afifellaceae bacterium]
MPRPPRPTARPGGAVPASAGLAVGLGGVGVTLADLVRLYAALAAGGRAVPLTLDREQQAEAA